MLLLFQGSNVGHQRSDVGRHGGTAVGVDSVPGSGVARHMWVPHQGDQVVGEGRLLHSHLSLRGPRNTLRQR